MQLSFRRWLGEEILQHHNLQTLLKHSGLEDTKVNGQQALALVKKYSAGLVHIEDYLKSPPGKRPGSGGYALGWTEEAFLYDLMAYLSQVENWKQAYPALTGGIEAKTDFFLNKLTTSGKPIVFFIPKEITKHNGVTSEEMMWYLKNPEKMKATYFVLGLYEMVNKDVWEKYLLPHEPHDLPIMTGVLNNPFAHFQKGKTPHNPPPGSEESEKELWGLKQQGDHIGPESLSNYLTRMDQNQEMPPRYPNPRASWRNPG